MAEVELIPGTALPVTVRESAGSGEGRGDVGGRLGYGPSLFEKIGTHDNLSPHEQAVVGAALRLYDRAPKHFRNYYVTAAGNTDATTGNCAIMLFQAPAGFETHITNVTVDIPGSATITPSAPFANAASFAYIAIAQETSTASASASVDNLRRGAVAFAPTAAAGPIIPGQWTFNDTSAPIAFGGSAVYFVLHGGSIAGILGQGLQVECRVNLRSIE